LWIAALTSLCPEEALYAAGRGRGVWSVTGGSLVRGPLAGPFALVFGLVLLLVTLFIVVRLRWLRHRCELTEVVVVVVVAGRYFYGLITVDRIGMLVVGSVI